MPTITALPGIALDRTLQLARLPLTIAESTIGPDDPSSWLPHVAFERVELTARETLGKLLQDQRLLDRASVQRAKLEQLQRAAVLERDAEWTEQKADSELEERREQAEERRQTAEAKADERQQELERSRAAAKSKVRTDAAQQKQSAKQRADAREKATKAREDVAKRTELDDRAEALTEEEQALAAKSQAIALEDELERKKAQRKQRS